MWISRKHDFSKVEYLWTASLFLLKEGLFSNSCCHHYSVVTWALWRLKSPNVCSTVDSSSHQRQCWSSTLLALVMGIRRSPLDSHHKGSVMQNVFSCHAFSWLPFISMLRLTWWRHQMETFSALLAICAGNSPVPGEFPTQRPVTWSFDVFFHLRLNKRLSKQSWGWWFETISRPLWRHCNE